MSNIKVGDVCIIIHFERDAELIGRECVVRLDDGVKKIRHPTKGIIYEVAFGVEIIGYFKPMPGTNGLVGVRREWLKKKPPDDTTSWETVESAAGWNPLGLPIDFAVECKK